MQGILTVAANTVKTKKKKKTTKNIQKQIVFKWWMAIQQYAETNCHG